MNNFEKRKGDHEIGRKWREEEVRLEKRGRRAHQDRQRGKEPESKKEKKGEEQGEGMREQDRKERSTEK